MKSLESRIVRLERAFLPTPGITLAELTFLVAIPTIWPDLSTAPMFIQAEHRRLRRDVTPVGSKGRGLLNRTRQPCDG
jgi:hypothetical protein